MSRQRGERIWEQMDEEYLLHLPDNNALEQKKKYPDYRIGTETFFVCEHEFIIALDGKLECVDDY